MSHSLSSVSTSAFEILGPIMVGPSSSHTAGALRLAQVASSLLEGNIASVKFTLWNSFARTYRGHGTDRALVAGMLGLQTDDERIRMLLISHRRIRCILNFLLQETTLPSTPIPSISK